MNKERKNNISKVSIEKEAPYGIYLPDWNSVVEAVHTFTSGDFQMAPLTKEEVAREKALREPENADSYKFSHHTNAELNLLSNLYSKEAAQPKEVNRVLKLAKDGLKTAGRGAFYYYADNTHTVTDLYDNHSANGYNFQGGFALYGKVLTLEAVGRKKKDDEEGKTYTEPYLLTTFSNFFEDNGEEKLADSLGKGRAILPRNVIVSFEREEGDVSRIDFNEIAEKLNNGLDLNVSGETIADYFGTKLRSHSLGEIDDFEVKITPLNAYKQSKEDESIKYLADYDKVGLEYRPVALEFSIADPTLESKAYGSNNLIPPEKREKARVLAEKIKDIFKPIA